MKHITRNPNVSRWRYIFSFGKKNNECVPLKAAVVEANNKSYLLDRIESLEDRLIQVSFFLLYTSYANCIEKLCLVNFCMVHGNTHNCLFCHNTQR